MKWYFALKLTFRKAVDANVITDPSVVLQTDPMIGLPGNDYENGSSISRHTTANR